MLEWYVLRWPASGGEGTFQEARTHLRFGDPAPMVRPGHCSHHIHLAETLPLTTLTAHPSQKHHPVTQRTVAWHDKPPSTFVDATSLARRHLRLASGGTVRGQR